MMPTCFRIWLGGSRGRKLATQLGSILVIQVLRCGQSQGRGNTLTQTHANSQSSHFSLWFIVCLKCLGQHQAPTSSCYLGKDGLECAFSCPETSWWWVNPMVWTWFHPLAITGISRPLKMLCYPLLHPVTYLSSSDFIIFCLVFKHITVSSVADSHCGRLTNCNRPWLWRIMEDWAIDIEAVLCCSRGSLRSSRQVRPMNDFVDPLPRQKRHNSWDGRSYSSHLSRKTQASWILICFHTTPQLSSHHETDSRILLVHFLLMAYVCLCSFISFVCIDTVSGSVQECPRSSMLWSYTLVRKAQFIWLIWWKFHSEASCQAHESFVFVSQPPCQALVWFVQEAHMWSNAGCMVEVRVVGWAASNDLNGVGDVTSLMSSKWKKSTAVPCCSYRFTYRFNSLGYIQLIPIVYFDDLWCSRVELPVASWGLKDLKESERHRSQGRSNKARQATC